MLSMQQNLLDGWADEAEFFAVTNTMVRIGLFSD